MKKVVVILGVIAITATIAVLMIDRGPTVPDGFAPLTGSKGDAAKLPADALIVNATNLIAVTAPMLLSERAPYAVLSLPDLSISNGVAGSAVFAVDAAQTGTQHAWARVRWKDSCANSFVLRAEGQRPFTVGQDATYGTWHWVRAGAWGLTTGPARFQIEGREDGIEVDQIVMTGDADYRPRARVGVEAVSFDPRRAGDDFNRSPGHGLGPWTPFDGEWSIAFSLDPNRIPMQYALRGAQSNAVPTRLLAADPEPWRGISASTALRLDAGERAGLTIESADGQALSALIAVSTDTATVQVQTPTDTFSAELPAGVAQQWNRIELEHWGSVLRVRVNDVLYHEILDVEPRAGRPGLIVEAGRPYFDDLAFTEIAWLGELPGHSTLDWTLNAESRWHRPLSDAYDLALRGDAGTITASLGSIPIEELIVETGPNGSPAIEAVGFAETGTGTRVRRFTGLDASAKVLRLHAKAGGDITRIVARAAVTQSESFTHGPYRFESSKIADPSDYLDFTEEEFEAIRTSPDRDKLKRSAKFASLVGVAARSPWVLERGAWFVSSGVLKGVGRRSELRYTHNVLCDATLSFEARFFSTNTVLDVALYSGEEAGAMIRLSGSAGDTDLNAIPPVLHIPADRVARALRLVASGEGVVVELEGKAVTELPRPRGADGGVSFRSRGGVVQVDNVSIEVPRRQTDAATYVFDRRETDWIRSGEQWIDHGGISCAYASHWISMRCPDDEAMLWNRRDWNGDITLGFRVEEHSEWFGWKKSPGHVHYPFHRILARLGATEDPMRGYALELNADEGQRLLLRRNGKEVAELPYQNGEPIELDERHNPYKPRMMDVVLAKRGAQIEVRLNRVPVLMWTDPDPIEVRRVGVGGRRSHANFSNIQIQTWPTARSLTQN